MEILNQIEIHEESRQSIIAGHQEMKDTLTDLSKDVKSLAAGISDLNKRFDNHMKTDTDNMKKDISKTLQLTEELRTASDKQRELLVQETRDHLLTKMEAALEAGEISSITELQRVGDLFDAYSDNGGNHGVGDVYEKYRKLPLKGGDK